MAKEKDDRLEWSPLHKDVLDPDILESIPPQTERLGSCAVARWRSLSRLEISNPLL